MRVESEFHSFTSQKKKKKKDSAKNKKGKGKFGLQNCAPILN